MTSVAAQPLEPGTPQASYPSVEVLILNWNGRDLLEASLDPLLQQDYPNFKVVLIDNASDDDSVAFTQFHFPQVKIVQHAENLGFSRGYNPVLRESTADVVVLLNNDVIVRPGWLQELIRPLQSDASIGAAGCKLLFPDGTIQHLGASLSYPQARSEHAYYHEPDAGQVTKIESTSYVTGAAMAIPRIVLQKIGLLDEGFSPFYFEEADFCYRARAAGYRVIVVPTSVAVHDESASMRAISTTKLKAYEKNRLRFVLKHYTPTQLIHDFVPAEFDRLREPATARLLQIRRQAYLQTAVGARNMLPQLNTDTLRSVQEALLRLHQFAARQTPQEYHPQPDSRAYATLSSVQDLTEFTIRSAVPLLGPLITAARRLWYTMAAKWAIRHLQQEQMRFNRLATRMLDEQAARAEADAREIGLLAAEIARLQQAAIDKTSADD